MTKSEFAYQEIIRVCKNSDVVIRYKLDFPVYKVIPDECKLAMKVLEKNGMRIVMELEEKK